MWETLDRPLSGSLDFTYDHDHGSRDEDQQRHARGEVPGLPPVGHDHGSDPEPRGLRLLLDGDSGRAHRGRLAASSNSEIAWVQANHPEWEYLGPNANRHPTYAWTDAGGNRHVVVGWMGLGHGRSRGIDAESAIRQVRAQMRRCESGACSHVFSEQATPLVTSPDAARLFLRPGMTVGREGSPHAHTITDAADDLYSIVNHETGEPDIAEAHELAPWTEGRTSNNARPHPRARWTRGNPGQGYIDNFGHVVTWNVPSRVTPEEASAASPADAYAHFTVSPGGHVDAHTTGRMAMPEFYRLLDQAHPGMVPPWTRKQEPLFEADDQLHFGGYFNDEYPSEDYDPADTFQARHEQERLDRNRLRALPNMMYHVAPVARRESILQQGLLPDASRVNTQSGHAPGVYLWEDPETAWNYRKQGPNMYEDMDMYGVQVPREQLKPDPWFVDKRPDRAADFPGAWYSEAPVPAEHVHPFYGSPWHPWERKSAALQSYHYHGWTGLPCTCQWGQPKPQRLSASQYVRQIANQNQKVFRDEYGQQFLRSLDDLVHRYPDAEAMAPWMANQFKQGHMGLTDTARGPELVHWTGEGRLRDRLAELDKVDGGQRPGPFEYTRGESGDLSSYRRTEGVLPIWQQWFNARQHPTRRGVNIMEHPPAAVMAMARAHQATIQQAQAKQRWLNTYTDPNLDEWQAPDVQHVFGPEAGKYKDWNVVKLNPYQAEGDSEALGHCIGNDEQPYKHNIEYGNINAYSLRDAQGYPHVSWHVNPDNSSIGHMQGSSGVPHDEYRHLITHFNQAHDLPDEETYEHRLEPQYDTEFHLPAPQGIDEYLHQREDPYQVAMDEGANIGDDTEIIHSTPDWDSLASDYLDGHNAASLTQLHEALRENDPHRHAFARALAENLDHEDETHREMGRYWNSEGARDAQDAFDVPSPVTNEVDKYTEALDAGEEPNVDDWDHMAQDYLRHPAYYEGNYYPEFHRHITDYAHEEPMREALTRNVSMADLSHVQALQHWNNHWSEHDPSNMILPQGPVRRGPQPPADQQPLFSHAPSKPPHYRLQQDPGEEKCGTCTMFNQGKCWGYGNQRVSEDGICDSYSADGRKSAGNTDGGKEYYSPTAPGDHAPLALELYYWLKGREPDEGDHNVIGDPTQEEQISTPDPQPGMPGHSSHLFTRPPSPYTNVMQGEWDDAYNEGRPVNTELWPILMEKWHGRQGDPQSRTQREHAWLGNLATQRRQQYIDNPSSPYFDYENWLEWYHPQLEALGYNPLELGHTAASDTPQAMAPVQTNPVGEFEPRNELQRVWAQIGEAMEAGDYELAKSLYQQLPAWQRPPHFAASLDEWTAPEPTEEWADTGEAPTEIEPSEVFDYAPPTVAAVVPDNAEDRVGNEHDLSEMQLAIAKMAEGIAAITQPEEKRPRKLVIQRDDQGRMSSIEEV